MHRDFLKLVLILLAGLDVLLVMPMSAHADTPLNLLVPPQLRRSPESLRFFQDGEGSLYMAYVRQSSEGPGEIFYLAHKNNAWSSPVPRSLPNGNFRFLHDVKRLSNGIPIMLFAWDKTDYISLFNITIDPANPPPADAPFPYPQEELQRLMNQNRQLFTSLYVNSAWSAPVPLSGTYRPVEAVLEAGADSTALVVFSRDEDNNEETLADRELYALAYFSNHWSTPIRLTSNSIEEHHVQAKYVNGHYLIVWSTDEDNNLSTITDKRVYFASMTPEGSLTTGATAVTPPFQNQVPPTPVLGNAQGNALLIWDRETTVEENVERTFYESRLSGSWSAAVDTGIKAGLIRKGTISESHEGALFVFVDGPFIRTAFNSGSGWHAGDPLFNLRETDLDFTEVNFLSDGAEKLALGVLGHVPSGNVSAEADPNEPDGLFYTSLILRPDLAVTSVQSTPAVKKLGGEVQIEAQVTNRGVFPSGGFTVHFRKGEEILQSISGESLSHGEDKTFSKTIVLNSVSLPLDVEVTSSVQELIAENNKMAHLVQVLPDYSVREVKKKDETTLMAVIDELKGVAAAPVTVDFYLAQEGEEAPVLLEQKTFDSNVALPVEVVWEPMRERTEPFRIEVKVNKERQVREDDYANNIGSYIFNPMPDLIISDVTIEGDLVRLKVTNQGDKPIERVDLLLADDPMTASQTELSAENPPEYFGAVEMGFLTEAQVSFNLSELGLTGDYIYSVVNPFGAVIESNRNNNLVRTRRADTAFKTASLGLVNARPGCDSVRVSVANSGEAPAVTSRVELMNSQRLVLADRVLSGINPGESKEASFENLAAAQYTLKLIDPVNGTEVPEIPVQVGVPQDEVCDGIDNDCDGLVDEELVDCASTERPDDEGVETPGGGEGPGGGESPAGGGDPGKEPGPEKDEGPREPGGFGLGGSCSLVLQGEPSSHPAGTLVLIVLFIILTSFKGIIIRKETT